MKVIAFDIETAAAEELHRYGPGFVRLCGYADVQDMSNVRITEDPREMVDALRRADAITAHNGINFDALALASQGWISFDDYEALCQKMFDTLLYARHLEPVAAKGAQAGGYYRLGETAERYGVDGKDTVDFAGKVAILRRIKGDAYADKVLKTEDAKQRRAERTGKTYSPPAPASVLKVLATAFGGFDRIPKDDPDYVRYLVKDVRAQGGLFLAMNKVMQGEPTDSKRYVRREHYTSVMTGRVTLEGARVDEDLNMKRWSEGQARLEAGKQLLHERHGMPLEGAKPHTTNAGKAAFRAAILATGISEAAVEANWKTSQDGSLAMGKDVLNELIPVFERTKPAAAELCRTILALNGERSVYGTIMEHTTDGRVHPYIGPDQASGRWSMKDPGLTVLGKRGGKARERAVILADNDDEVLVAIDADQVDARVIAAMCQDAEYLKLFEPGMDLHSEVAFRVWPNEAQHGPDCHTAAKPDCGCGVIRKCHCEKRDQAKVFGHGFSYGLGANGMARQHGVDTGVAQGFVLGMTEAFPRLAEWKGEIREAAGALPYGEAAPANDRFRILHTWAGRPVRVERERAYTQATALVGQGGTRDVMAEAALRLPVAVRRRIRAIIHDEFLISLPKAGAEEAAQRIADQMAFDLKGVAITFGISRVSRSWAGCYGAEYEQAA